MIIMIMMMMMMMMMIKMMIKMMMMKTYTQTLGDSNVKEQLAFDDEVHNNDHENGREYHDYHDYHDDHDGEIN